MSMTFSDIKSRIAGMIAEAEAIAPSSPFWVSRLWKETVVYLDYVRELSDAQLQFIRVHTSLITGVAWFNWAHNPSRFTGTDEDRETIPLIQTYLNLVDDLPEDYWGDEPTPNEPTRLVGLPFRGRLVSDDLVRYQRAVTNLYNAGLFRANPNGRRRLFFEIGGGYGGLAHQIRRMMEANSTYVIVDLPEMLFWSAVFLRLNNPSRRIYVYDPSDFLPARLDDILASHDFVLLPHYLLERLPSFPTIDVAINTLSMQEMPDAQVRAYCDFLARRLQGWFYSENFARHVYNEELTSDLYDIFAEYFITIPAMKLSGHPQIPHHLYQLYTYLLTPRSRPADYTPVRPILHGNNYSFALSVVGQQM